MGSEVVRTRNQSLAFVVGSIAQPTLGFFLRFEVLKNIFQLIANIIVPQSSPILIVCKWLSQVYHTQQVHLSMWV